MNQLPKPIGYGRQHINSDDIDAVVEVLRSDFLTQGSTGQHFEDALCQSVNARHAIAVNSATSALHLSCRVLGVGPGDIVWTSPNSFVASANCALYCGAAVDFVDIEPDTANMCPDLLEQKLATAAKANKLPKVLIVVHFSGCSANMNAICRLARNYDVKIIEDASHAVGGRYLGAPVGNCALSDIAVFSFHPVKMITTGEGGALVTNDDYWADEARKLRTHGITRSKEEFIFPEDQGDWYYEQHDLGLNYRMTDFQAALGLSQLKRLWEFVERRNEIAQKYDRAFADTPIETLRVPESTVSSFHLYVIRVAADNRARVFKGLREAQIGVNVHYIPIHLQPFYRKMGFSVGDFEKAERYYSEAISIPIFFELSDQEQSFVISKVLELTG